MKHLYITEDEGIFVHHDPTPGDLNAVENGYLRIIRFVNDKFEEIDPETKKFRQIKPGILALVEGKQYHCPAPSRECCAAENREPHSCPFQADVHGNNDPEYCDCCEECEYQCSQDI